MNPQKAYSLGVKPEDIRVETFGDKYRGDWLVYVPDDERGKIILTSSPDIFAMCHWAATLKRLYVSQPDP